MGIVGIADENGIDQSLWDEMIKSMIYEDSFKKDTYVNERFALGRIHLGILNPEPQPVFNEDKTLCAVMDGEIFNSVYERQKLLSKRHAFNLNDDPSFCLHLYEENGQKFVNQLNGSFALTILDTKKNELLITSDRYCLRPLYYYNRNGRLLFASEVKAIIQDKKLKKEINEDAIAEFFTFGHLLGDKTFLKGVNVFPPASILVYCNRQIKIKKYWDFKFDERHSETDNEYYVNALVQLFKQAVERTMKGNHHFGVSLSGGLDSRAVVASVDKKHYPITTITFNFPGTDDTPKIARKIAKTLGTTHREFEIEMDFLKYAGKCVYITDGMLNLRCFHVIGLLDRFRESADVILDGWESETTFKGKFLDNKIICAHTNAELARILYEKFRLITEEEKKQLFSSNYYNKVRWLAFKSVKEELNKSKNRLLPYKANYYIFQNRERRFFTYAFVYRRTKYEDRKPFRDNDLMDFSLKIPWELTYKERVYLKFLKKLLTKPLRIEDNHTRIRVDFPARPAFSKILLYKDKVVQIIRRILRFKNDSLGRGDYPDYAEWIRKNENLRRYVQQILLDDRTLGRKYFNKNYIKTIIEEHMSHKKNHGNLILVLLTFELWHRFFMDD